MRAIKGITILGSAALLALALVSAVEAALDPPHGSTTVVDCKQCHDLYGQSLPDGGNPDSTPLNQLCRQAACHGDGSPYAKLTHSSATTSSEEQYGVWSQDCVDCHDPHTQRQAYYLWSYSNSTNPGGLIETGSIISVVGNVLTVSFHNAPQAANYWAGKMINIKGKYSKPNNWGAASKFYITSSLTNTITLAKSPSAAYGPYTQFGINYGGLIKETVYTRRAVANSSGVVYNTNTWRQVKFMNSASKYSPGYSLTDQKAICIVCHTRTKAFNIGYAQFGQSFDNTVDYFNQWHKDNVSSGSMNCWSDATACHKEPKYGFDANCGGCHGQPPIGAETMVKVTAVNDPWYSGRTQGAHQAHVTAGRSECDYCHKGGGSADAGHKYQDKITMGFSYVQYQGSYQAGGTFQNTYTAASGATNTTVSVSGGTRLCNNLYCHSDGGNYAASYTYRQMNWDTAGSLACDKCHGDQAGKKVITNVHPSHINATSYNYSCYECHSATVDADNTIPAGKKAAHLNGSKNVSIANISAGGSYSRPNCSSVYCHTDGDGGAPMSAPAWNDAGSVNGCNACHDAAGATSTQLSAAHAAHTNTSGNAYACTSCHDATLATDTTIGDYSLHINKAKNVDAGLGYASSKCSTTNCHGTSSAAWTADLSAYNDCTKCHGEKTASPTEAQKAPGGAGTDTSGVDTAATDAQVGAHQAHLKSDVNYTVDVACSACHQVPGSIGAVRHIDNSLPADLTFSSFVANYGSLTPAYSGGKCSNTYCHGAKMVNSTGQGVDETPGWTNTTYLNGVPGVTGDCDMCHASPPSGYAGSAHDGNEGIAACAGCHEHFNTDGSLNNTILHIDGIVQGAGCAGCHGQPPIDGPTMVKTPDYTGRGPGAHQSHYAKYASCSACHTGGGGSGHTSIKKITMGFNYGYQPGAVVSVFNAPTLANAYTLQSGYANTTTNVTGATRVCYNVYCHSDGGNYAQTFTYRTPDWDGGALACDSCHGNQAGTKAVTEVHPIHVTTYDYSCYECHSATVDANETIPAGKEAMHVNSSKNVSLANLAAGGSYTRPNCTSINSCHGDGNGGAPTNTPAWNNANSLPANCTGCHKGTVASANPMASIRHASHIDNSGTLGTNYDCNVCHVKTTVTANTINTVYFHVNAVKNVTFTALNPSGTYNNGTKACTNVYCHSIGTATPVYNTPDWDNGAAMDCTGCHAMPNSTGTHAKHVASASDCADCHMGTTHSGTSIAGGSALHIDGIRNVVINTAYDSNGSTSNWNGTQCNSVYCHGAGTPTWGGAALNCASCHAGDKTLLGRHDMHYNTASVIGSREQGSNNSIIANTIYTCGVCHYNANHATGEVVPTHQTANVAFNSTFAGNSPSYTSGVTNTADGSFKFTNGVCGVYCHSNGTTLVGPFTNTTVTWNSAIGSLTCAGCHNYTQASGTPMATIRHASHINNATVLGTNNDCFDCHYNTTQNNTSIANAMLHTNGVKNVTFSAAVGGTYDNGTKACSSTYCHSDGNDSSTRKYTAPDWDSSAAMDCKGCHGTTSTYGEPAYANTGAGVVNSNSHAVHVSAAADCKKCHLGTTNDGTSITAVGNHINGTQDVAIDTPYDTNGGTSNWAAGSKQCSSVTCHGSGTPIWGGVVTCRSCHGSATADSDNFYYSGGGGSAGIIALAGEWNTTGHGRPSASGAYPMSNNPAGNFDGLAGAGDGCRWCHDSTANHGLVTNPFRLKNNNALGNGWNDACLYCHDTGQTTASYTAGEAGFTGMNLATVVKVDKYHQMQAHTDSVTNGGKFCWDCHDPHGDASNIQMIHAKVAKKTDGTYGNPGGNLANLVGAPVVFTNRYLAIGAGGFAMNTGTYTQGVCNVCHTTSASSPKMLHYTSGDSDSHNSGTNCTVCHSHSADTTNNGEAFKGGGCNGCHAYPPTPGDGKAVYSVQGKGAHVAHTDHIGNLAGLTLDPNTDTFGDSKYNLTCGVCHKGATHTTEAPTTTNRTIVVNSTSYMLGTTGSASYNGAPGTAGSTTAKTCSNISCHYSTTPEWESY